MKIRVAWIGKTKDASLARLIGDYVARIKHFLPFEIVELREPKTGEAKRLAAEAEKLLATIDPSDRLIVLDVGGKSWTSQTFAQFVGKHMREDPRRLTFMIGGHSGISDSVKKRADVLLSLSPLTFTHDLSRVVLLEQIYRALTIIHNHPYSR